MRERKPDVRVQIDRLERKHGHLSMQVAELESHMFLSASDQLLVRSLKKEKLAAKDALADLTKRV